MSDRKKREQEFHDKQFANENGARKAAAKYYSVMDRTKSYYSELVIKLCHGARLLEYGCGSLSYALVWAKNGADVTGIDISSEAIKLAKKYADKNELDISFHVMDAETLEFEDDVFDVIAGTGILHHLNLNKSYGELSRVLKKGGHAIFIEPIGHNFLFNLYRKLTPEMRTDDEHPLLIKDIELARQYFMNINVKYFCLFSFFAVPFRNMPFFRRLLSFLHLFDEILMHIFPFVKRYAFAAVLDFFYPRFDGQ